VCVFVCVRTRFHTCMVHVSFLINNLTINIGLQIICLASYSFSTIPVLVIVGRENGVDELKLTGSAERTGTLMRCGLALYLLKQEMVHWG